VYTVFVVEERNGPGDFVTQALQMDPELEVLQFSNPLQALDAATTIQVDFLICSRGFSSIRTSTFIDQFVRIHHDVLLIVSAEPDRKSFNIEPEHFRRNFVGYLTDPVNITDLSNIFDCYKQTLDLE